MYSGLSHEQTTVIQVSQYQIPEKMTKKRQPMYLNLGLFKVYACETTAYHNHKQCIFYHGPKDRRRDGPFYSSEMCEYAENGENGLNCMYGDACTKSHNKVESLYQFDKYKKKFCTLYPGNTEACEYGVYCSFAHDECEIMIELIHNFIYDQDFYLFHYKTVQCPFNYVNHDRANCVYAHNWQDFRRKVTVAQYQPVTCPFWKTSKLILKYEQGCPNNYSCLYSHGWKEIEYHPLIFKIKKCAMGQRCNKGGQCSYYHNQIEQRFIPLDMVRSVPRNRFIDGVYKPATNFHFIQSKPKQQSKSALKERIRKSNGKQDYSMNDETLNIRRVSEIFEQN